MSRGTTAIVVGLGGGVFISSDACGRLAQELERGINWSR